MTEPPGNHRDGTNPQALTVTVQHDGTVLTIGIAGDLAADTVTRAGPLATVPPGVEHVVVDLAGVGFIDLAGVRALQRAQTFFIDHGASFTLRDLDPSARWLMELTAATSLLPAGPAGAEDQRSAPPDGQEHATGHREQHLHGPPASAGRPRTATGRP